MKESAQASSAGICRLPQPASPVQPGAFGRSRRERKDLGEPDQKVALTGSGVAASRCG
jgi:hypothetical protein